MAVRFIAFDDSQVIGSYHADDYHFEIFYDDERGLTFVLSGVGKSTGRVHFVGQPKTVERSTLMWKTLTRMRLNPENFIELSGRPIRRAAEPAILAALQWQRDHRNELAEVIDRCVPGLEILRRARRDSSIESLSALYPAATAYLRAETFFQSTNERKALLGKIAILRILAAEDPVKVIQDMESEWETVHQY